MDTLNKFLFTQPNSEKNIRIFFFPYAGSGASIGEPYYDLISPKIDFIPIQLPGRENRLFEDPYTEIDKLTEPLLQEISPYLDKPFVFWGHCSGGLIAFDLAQKVQTKLGLNPHTLIASGCAAPQVAHTILPHCFHQLSDEDFIDALANLMKNQFPENKTTSNKVKIILSSIRADFTLYEKYNYFDNTQLNCPIYIFSGEHDNLVNSEHLIGWQHVTNNHCAHKVFLNQGHYFINNCQEDLVKEIEKIIL